MRTKTLILTAALSAAGLATSLAQSVYSVNAVGYVNVTIAPGFKMISNPLNAPTNTLGALIPVAPDGASFYKFTTGVGYSTFVYDELAGSWQPNGNVSLAPGEGGFFRNNQTTNIVITFVGEVMQGTLTNNLPTGFSIRSSQVPQQATVNVLGLPGQDGDSLYKFTQGVGYSTFVYDSLAGDWTPSVPTIDVGEAFWIKKLAGENWVRTFSANGP